MESAHRQSWTLKERLRWLADFECRLAVQADSFAHDIEAEVGKPFHEALTGDVMPLLAACRWNRRSAPRLLHPRSMHGRALWQFGQRHRQSRVPLGTVAIIATWNYPVQLLGIQLIQALLTGNVVVVKPSEHAPRVQERLLRLAIECGAPEFRLSWVEPTREAGATLLRERHFDHIIFTGSTSVGRSIAEWAASTLTPTTLELSGRDSAIVLEDADPALAARTIWHAVTMNAGQTCMAPRRALVHRDVYDAFVREIMPLAAAARPATLISIHAADAAFELARDAIDAGGRSASGVLEPPEGRSLRPIAILDCDPHTSIVEGNHFGPVLAVVPVQSVDVALDIHRHCDQHLATSIFTRRPARVRNLAAALRASHITINDCVLPTAHPASTLGGHARSGWGVTRGREGLLALTRPVTISSTSPLIRPPTGAPTAKLVTRLSSLIRFLYARGAKPRTHSESPLKAVRSTARTKPHTASLSS